MPFKKWSCSYRSIRGFEYTEIQVKKKLENMKTRLKKKIDKNKTGNVPIVLSKSERMLMDILDGNDNPSINRLSCSISIVVNLT